jgi:hypothetical protein
MLVLINRRNCAFRTMLSRTAAAVTFGTAL